MLNAGRMQILTLPSTGLEMVQVNPHQKTMDLAPSPIGGLWRIMEVDENWVYHGIYGIPLEALDVFKVTLMVAIGWMSVQGEVKQLEELEGHGTQVLVGQVEHHGCLRLAESLEPILTSLRCLEFTTVYRNNHPGQWCSVKSWLQKLLESLESRAAY